MSRAQRLLELIQVLRRHRYPVSGAALASELGVSLRTLYRDIATLQEQGARIDGEAGVGYVLRSGFTIPPLMFNAEEIEAIVLGSRWVAERGDTRLAAAAKDALAKIADVVPSELQEQLESNSLLVVGSANSDIDLAVVRDAIRTEHKLRITYRDGNDSASARTIWPFAVGFFEKVRVIAAWCELRDDFRSFRADRIGDVAITDVRYPKPRRTLLHEWRKRERIDREA